MARKSADTSASASAASGGAPAPSFEEAIEQVEAIIARIEGGEQGLERSIADYEQGAGLIKVCREILERSEQRISQIEADLSSAGSGGGAMGGSGGSPGGAGGSALGGAPGGGSKSASRGSTPPPGRADDGDDTPF